MPYIQLVLGQLDLLLAHRSFGEILERLVTGDDQREVIATPLTRTPRVRLAFDRDMHPGSLSLEPSPDRERVQRAIEYVCHCSRRPSRLEVELDDASIRTDTVQ